MTNHDSLETLGYLLSRTYYAYKKAATKAAAPYGITPDQYGILHRLSKREAISQKELAELHARDQTAVGKIIDKLEHKGLIVRTVDPRDRRAVLLYLTEDGKRMVEELTIVMQQTDKQASSTLSNVEYKRFTETLSEIYRNIRD